MMALQTSIGVAITARSMVVDITPYGNYTKIQAKGN